MRNSTLLVLLAVSCEDADLQELLSVALDVCIEGFSTQEVRRISAERLGISNSTMNRRVKKAREWYKQVKYGAREKGDCY